MESLEDGRVGHEGVAVTSHNHALDHDQTTGRGGGSRRSRRSVVYIVFAGDAHRSIDVLDQFSPPAQPAPPRPSSPQPVADENEFEAKLAEEMESLFRGFGSGAGSGGTEREQLAAVWEAMLIEGMDGALDPSTSNARASSSRPKEANFQSHIRSTINRLRESESGLQSPASGDGESLESLRQQLQDLSGADGENTEQLQGMLEEMMGQLMSREVLYEPLKELHEKASMHSRLTRILA